MLSRVAENIFWMSRYMERTNNDLRNLKYQYISFQDGLTEVSYQDVLAGYGIAIQEQQTLDEVLNKVLFDVEQDSSVINNIFRARENARSAQDNINRELWQCLNDLYHQVREPFLQRQLLYDPITVIDELIKRCMQYYGIINNSISRSEGFYFLNMGKFVERGLHCTEMLKNELKIMDDYNNENQRWRYFLMSLNGYELYLSKHFGEMTAHHVLDQMLYEDNYPSSLSYCWQELTFYADVLYTDNSTETARNLKFVIGKAYSHLKYSDSRVDVESQIQFLDEMQSNFYKLIYVLNRHCFGLTV